MLEVNNVTKTYKHSKNPAIKGISFSVKNGEIFGLIGKNGAGKSTTLKSILGIHPFEEGQIVLNGIDQKKQQNLFKKNIGYVPDNHAVYEMLTGREYVNFMADIYGVGKDREELIENYAKMFGIEDALDKQIGGYSHGMHQKICIIGALIHSPNLWILDEPFMGLDGKSINMLKQRIKEFASDSKMVLFTSHDIDTVVEICDRVCVLDHGQVLDIFDMSKANDVKKLKDIML